MFSWWHRDVIAAGKLPLMLCFVSFVVTFVSTRVIILLIVGAFTAVGGPGTLSNPSGPGSSR
ncbi:MAG: hypothetical protein ACRDNF_19300 [Streptosporangiaceae bacterium]